MSVRMNFMGLALFVVFSASVCCEAQVKYELYNEQGATVPCIGIGIGIMVAKKRASAFEKVGFVR